ncbi:MAG TPA: peptide ABC transporter substrate-binding protein [Aliidongia sp.]|nr:peptide ABC transporter substrate-binding protein [Aliidongia sp.]
MSFHRRLAALSLLMLPFSPAQAQTVLREGNATECGTLDPAKFQQTNEDRIISDLYEGLTAPLPGGAIGPGQAESWTVSEDGKVWSFTLRPGLEWSNGDTLTAEDFVYSLRRQVDPANGFVNAFLEESIENAAAIESGKEKDLTRLGVEAPDPRTVRITLAVPNPALPAILSRLRPVHRASVEATPDTAFRAGTMVSNGAYRLVEWQQQSRIILARNPHYWDAAHVRIDQVEYYPIEDATEELKRYRSGGLDITATVPHDQLAMVKSTFGSEYMSYPFLAVYYLGFNLTQPPFKDNFKLREALTLAVDRDLLVDKIAVGGNTAAYGYVPPGMKGYPNPSVSWRNLPQAEREAMARRDYAEAGYSAEHPLSVELSYNTSDNHKKLMIAIAGMWKRVLGVNTTLSNQEFKTFLDVRREKKTTQAFRSGYIAFYDDPAPIMDIFRSANLRNDSGYYDQTFDRMFEEAVATPDPALRLSRLAEAETHMLADLPVLPLFHYASEHMVKPYVKGLVPSPRDSYRSQDLEIVKQPG